MATQQACEICGEEVAKVTMGTTCGHPVYLCDRCREEYPGVDRLCEWCENVGINPVREAARRFSAKP